MKQELVLFLFVLVLALLIIGIDISLVRHIKSLKVVGSRKAVLILKWLWVIVCVIADILGCYSCGWYGLVIGPFIASLAVLYPLCIILLDSANSCTGDSNDAHG